MHNVEKVKVLQYRSEVAAPSTAFLCTGMAQAKVAVPFQDSIRKAGSSSEASGSGYGMEGRPRGMEAKNMLIPAQHAELGKRVPGMG